MKFSTKFILLCAGLVILASFSIVYPVHLVADRLLENELQRIREESKGKLLNVDRMIFERLGDLRAIAIDPIFCAEIFSAKQTITRLVAYRNTYKTYISISYFDRNGFRLADSSGLGLGEQQDPTSFLAQHWEDILRDRFLPSIGCSQNINENVLFFAQPIQCASENTPRGIVITSVAFSQIHRLLNESDDGNAPRLSSVKIDLEDESGLLLYSNNNRDGILKAHSIHPSKMIPTYPYEDEATSRIVMHIKEPGYLDYKGNGWSLRYSVRRDDVFAPIIALYNNVLIIFLIVFVLAIIAAFLFSQYLTKPIQVLIDTALDIESNHLSYCAQISQNRLERRSATARQDEFDILIEAFDRMIVKLHTMMISRKLMEQIIQEMTEQTEKATKEFRESAKSMKLFFSLSGDLLCITDVAGHLLRISNSWEKILGYSLDELQGMSIMELLHPDDVERLRIAMQVLLEQDDPPLLSFIDRYRHKDGSWRWIEWSVATHKKQSFYATGRDITDHKQFEALLVDAQKQSEIANQSKSDFLANMSHEIRTPMNAIIGLSDLALRIEMSPRLRDYLTKIAYSSQSLLRIINDVLDFSKIEAGKLDLEMSDFLLKDVFEHLSDMFREKTTERYIELVMCISEECRYELRGDAFRLEQVLMNLIGNAIKFTSEGEIEVRVRTTQDSIYEVTLEFSVRDTGIGMTGAHISKLFLPFTQADSSVTRKFGGTGLGLSISKKLVKMMGGEIWINSSPDHGSTFYFTTIFQRKPDSGTGDMISPEDMACLKVLVVDDNESARSALQNMLIAFDFSAMGIGSGQEAIHVIKQGIVEGNPYQLLLIDWLMPGMDGIQTLQQLKEDIAPERLPKTLLLIPYDREEELRLLGETLEVNAYLPKPINCSILFDTIMTTFGRDVPKASRGGRDFVDTEKVVRRIGGARVLLVEDNTINQQVAREILEDVGLVVDIADDGLEATLRVTEAIYDVVLMDIQMPNMDGYQASRQIRGDPLFAKLPIIAMTAHAMSGDREKCLQAGINDYISKPVNKSQLYEKLVEWILPRDGLGLVFLPKRNKDSEENRHLIPETLPGIDVYMALERLNGNGRLYLSLLLEFLRDYAQSGQQIRSFLMSNSEEDTALAKKLIHTVKGTAGNISAIRLFDAALMMEKKLELSLEEQLGALEIFENALNEVVAGIVTIKQEETIAPELPVGANPPPLAMGEIIPLMRELSQRLKRKTYSTQESFDALKPLLRYAPAGVGEELKRLEEQIDQINFKDALGSLAIIANIFGIDLKDSV